MASSELQELAPAILLLSYVAGAGVYFALFSSKTYRDQEIARRTTGVSTASLRVFFSWLMSPWLRLLVRSQIPANAITSISLALSLFAAVALAAGHFSLGGSIFLLASVCDYFDGNLARRQGGGTAQGAALDSIVDRYSEVALISGLCWYYRETWVLLPALLALSGALLVPYTRAKAEALGARLSDVGMLQRPERAAILIAMTGLTPLADALVHQLFPQAPQIHWLSVAGLVVLALGTQVTAAQRTIRLLQLLESKPKGWSGSGSRAVVSSVVATASDAALVAALSWTVTRSLPLATAAGCVLGALVNFTLNRRWAFQSTDRSIGQQGVRYIVVSGTSLLFNTGGVAVMELLPAVPDALAWLVVRAVIFGTWTFPLFRAHVFPPNVESQRSSRLQGEAIETSAAATGANGRSAM